MDNKAEFHNIQTELEELLVKYKNAFPKNLRQFLRSDLLIIPIIVTIIAIIACFNYSCSRALRWQPERCRRSR